MKRCLIILLLTLPFCAVAQNQNSVWCFGDSAGIDFSNLNNPLPYFSAVEGRGSCASIADSNGNLQFYSYDIALSFFETRILNSNHLAMAGSGQISGGGLYSEEVIIPKPASDSLYYLFYTGVIGAIDSTYYALINMKSNGGLGSVISKNNFLDDYRPADCLTAIKHGNGRDWWIINKLSNVNGTNHNRFYIYLITPDSISTPKVKNFNDATDLDFQKIVFNSDGSKLMLINTLGYMCEFNFNRCNGELSISNLIYPEQTGPYDRQFNSGAYSLDGRFFYTSTFYDFGLPNAYLLQYDLTAPDIPASCDTLDSLKTPIGLGTLRLAPDGKIYISCAYEYGFPGNPYPDSVRNYVNENLSVINYPDSVGAACDYQPFSFHLGGKRTYYGLPNNPNYSLGPLAGSGCDTITASPTLTLPAGEGMLFVYYHTGWQKAFINAQKLKGKNYHLRVTDMLGNVVFNEDGILSPSGAGGAYFTKDLNCSSFSTGMYIVTLRTEKERLVKKFVKQ